MERWEWAWLAGIYEGEGTLGFSGDVHVQIRIGMTDKDVIDTIQRLFPGNPHRFERKNRIKPLHVWQLGQRDRVKEFLEGIYPYLHERRKTRVDEAFERLARNLGPKSKRTHCIHGHPLEGENVYINQANGGTRSCWTCRRERDKKRKRRC